MFMSHKFAQAFANHRGDLELSRSGVAKRVIIPEAFVEHITFDVNISGTDVVFSGGESLFILTDEFGVVNNSDPIDADMFFVDGGILVELLEGKIVLKDEEGNPYCVDQDGEISYPRSNSRIIYSTAENLYGIAARIVGHRYGAPERMWNDYLNNLLLSTEFSCTSNGGEPCMNARFVTQFEDLGCGVFPFVDFYEQLEVDEDADPDNFDNIDDDEDEDEDDNDEDFEEEDEDENDY